MNLKNFSIELYPYLKKHVAKFIIVLIAVIMAASLESYLPELIGNIIDNLFSYNNNNIAFYALLVFFVISFSAIFSFIATTVSIWVANTIIMKIRIAMFDKLLKLPKKYFDKNLTGTTISKLTYDVDQLSTLASTLWINFIKSSLIVIILVTYLFVTSWLLSLLLFIILPIIYIVLRLSNLRIKKMSTIVQQSVGEMTHNINENITNNVLVKVYDMYQDSNNKFINIANNLKQKNFKLHGISALNILITSILIAINLALVVYIAKSYTTMTAGEFTSFFTAMSMLIKPTKNLININRPLQQALAAGDSIFKFLAEAGEKSSGKNIKIKGVVEFKNVDFAYNKKHILHNISFTVSRGESLALVGTTGSGKSTIASIITGLYSIQGGEVLIDGTNINDLSLKCLRKNIALVEQRVSLFSDSIKNNITLNNNVTTDQLIASAKIANAYEFINNLNDKFNETVANNGTKLSGGQAQRIAIARAIIKNAKILILDEATSALDSKTEKLIQQSMLKLQKDKTVIIITHRLNTVINADKIAVLEHGKIVEFGSHKDLLKKEGFYYKLYQHQLK